MSVRRRLSLVVRRLNHHHITPQYHTQLRRMKPVAFQSHLLMEPGQIFVLLQRLQLGSNKDGIWFFTDFNHIGA